MNSGQEDIIAILFDMNLLFERFFYSQLKKCEESFEHRQLSILGQVSKEFWNSKTIRPDILLEYDIKDKKRVIIDTKWKILDSIYPSDTDLKQMYTYNLHFDANKSVLVYPYTSIDTNVPIRYVPSLSIQKEHYCQTYCVNIFDEKGNIRKSFAKEFIENILN
jgi:5-methylcytosine-specific restriction enzyme subunit McrC